jgi:acyl-coenzyme A thioesterase PaaI-like protein
VSDAPQYPPPTHVLRDLALEVESRPDGTASGWLRVTSPLVLADGSVEPGALAALVDVLGGGVSIRSVAPDWATTADLTLQLVRTDVAAGGTIEGNVAVVRKGRTTLVLEVDLRRVDDRAPVGWGSMTFAVLPRRDDTLEWNESPDEVTRTAFGADGDGFAAPMLDAVGATVVEPGVVSMPWSPYVRNSMGAVQGGVLAMLGAAAGRSALGDAPVLDLHVAYLAQAREGPVVATADVLAPGAATVLVRDAERVTTVVHVGAAA